MGIRGEKLSEKQQVHVGFWVLERGTIGESIPKRWLEGGEWEDRWSSGMIFGNLSGRLDVVLLWNKDNPAGHFLERPTLVNP